MKQTPSFLFLLTDNQTDDFLGACYDRLAQCWGRGEQYKSKGRTVCDLREFLYSNGNSLLIKTIETRAGCA